MLRLNDTSAGMCGMKNEGTRPRNCFSFQGIEEMDGQPNLASDEPLIKRLERIPDLLTMRLLRTEERRKIFFRKFGSVQAFVAGRVIDLTADIKNNDPNDPGPLVISFLALNAKLFPIESERETSSGLKAYVQPDRTEASPLNERRIIGIRGEDKTEIVAAAVYGVSATPEHLRGATGIDGVVGLTYAMVDENYRRTGLGKYIANELVPQTAEAFLLNRGIDNAHIILSGEINDVRKLTFEEALSDIEKTELMPNARRAFWQDCGYKPLDWPDYAQLKLRKDLEPFAALDLFIAGWKEPEVPSELVLFLVDYHAKFCLNKQQGLDDSDRGALKRMRKSLAQKPLIGFQTVPDHRTADCDLLAAMRRAAYDNAPAHKLVQNILDRYTTNTEG
jgi:GNAT superfamily N-acetyltransferase